jgi:hypothetical protein
MRGSVIPYVHWGADSQGLLPDSALTGILLERFEQPAIAGAPYFAAIVEEHRGFPFAAVRCPSREVAMVEVPSAKRSLGVAVG